MHFLLVALYLVICVRKADQIPWFYGSTAAYSSRQALQVKKLGPNFAFLSLQWTTSPPPLRPASANVR